MIKPGAKTLLALFGIASLGSIALTVAYLVLIGVLHISVGVIAEVTCLLGVGLLAWLVLAAQMRNERRTVARSTNNQVKELQREITTLVARVEAVDANQRKNIDITLGGFATSHDRADEVAGRLGHELGEAVSAKLGVPEESPLMHELIEVRESVAHVLDLSTEEGGSTQGGIRHLTASLRRAERSLATLDERNRKILNVLRTESRDAEVRFAEFGKQISANGLLSGKALAAAEDAALATRKMHNFLRRDGSIQLALDHFLAGERRVLAAVDSAGLDHGDQVALLRDELRDLSNANGDLVGQQISDAQASFDALHLRVGRLIDSQMAGSQKLSQRLNDLELSIERHSAPEQESSGGIGAPLDRPTVAGADVRVALTSAISLLQSDIELLGKQSVEHKHAVVEELRQVVHSAGSKIQRQSRKDGIESVRQIEALVQLMPRVDTATRRFPASGWWALSADTLLFLSDYIERERPQNIVEIGSGASSIWVGSFASKVGAHLTSLEHDGKYARETQRMVEDFDLSETVTVIEAGLKPTTVSREEYLWYDVEATSDLPELIDLLIVDGPPEATGNFARFPALPLLADRLRPGAVILLDDTHRPDEQEILESWMRMFPQLLLRHEGLMRTEVLESR